MGMQTGLVFDPIFLRHQNPQGHPERVERLSAIHGVLTRSGLLKVLRHIDAPSATTEVLSRVHQVQYIESMDKLSGRTGFLDSDTYISPDSIDAAHKAAGGVVALAEAVWNGKLNNGFALVRPPGHHAEADRAMGFCLFNNIAVAAAALRAGGANRVAIYDWDVHHGNGTQHMFDSDPSVLYLSTHQFPFYPGTGAAREVGLGEGRGRNVNIPLPGGCNNADYIEALDTVIMPIIEQFEPDILLISAGFDIYANDPLAGMRITTQGFAAMAQRLHALARRVCQGRIVYVLEGGYDIDGLCSGVEACIADLIEPQPAPTLSERTTDGWNEARETVLGVQRAFWKV